MAAPSLKRLVREIHRRSLWQVLGIYLVASWAVLSVVDTLGGALNLPDWFPSVAFALLIVGLPVVLATAFLQEGGPGRDARDVEGGGAPTEAPAPGGVSDLFTWRNAFTSGVLAFALLGFVGSGWILFGGGLRRSEPTTSLEQSVAVLPCTDLSAAGDQAPLTQGFAEGIISGLAQLPDLKVIGLTSVIALLEENADIETFGRRLNVSTVLECDLQQVGETLRVRPRLVEAATGAVLWSETIDGPTTNLFAFQDSVARAVTDELQVTLAGRAETPLVTQGTTVPEAHDAYLIGRHFFNQRTARSLREAITEFQRAIRLDSDYAEAYSGLADSYFLVYSYTLTDDFQEEAANIAQGLVAARRAVQLDPNLGMAHASLGFGLWNDGDWEGAERELELAIDLNPGYATVHYWYGRAAYSTGNVDEGVIHAERAFELDPVSRAISLILSRALQRAGRSDEAMAQRRETVALAPEWRTGWLDLSQALLDLGEYEEGLEAFVRYFELGSGDVQAAREGYEAAIRYRQTGQPQTFPDFPWNFTGRVWLYVQTGQRDRAMSLLEDRIRAGAHGRTAAFIARAGLSDLLGDEPRYRAALAEAGITL